MSPIVSSAYLRLNHRMGHLRKRLDAFVEIGKTLVIGLTDVIAIIDLLNHDLQFENREDIISLDVRKIAAAPGPVRFGNFCASHPPGQHRHAAKAPGK